MSKKNKKNLSTLSPLHCCGTTMEMDAGCWYCPKCDTDGIRQLIIDAVGSNDPECAIGDFNFWMSEKDEIISNTVRAKEALDQIQEYLQDNYGVEDDLVVELESEFGEDFCLLFGELGESINELHKVTCEHDRKTEHSWIPFNDFNESLISSSITKHPNRIFFTEVTEGEDDFCFGSYILSFDLLLIMDKKDLESLDSIKL